MLKIRGAYAMLLATVLGAVFAVVLMIHDESMAAYFDPADLAPSLGYCEAPLWLTDEGSVPARSKVYESVVGPFMADGFAQTWRDAGEPSLYRIAKGGDAPKGRIVRFTWHPGYMFHGVIATAQERPDGSILFAAKWVARPGAELLLVEEQQRVLTPAEGARLRTLLDRNPPDELDRHFCLIGPDGRSWTLESVEGDDFNFAARHSPDHGALYEIGKEFLRLTQWPSWDPDLREKLLRGEIPEEELADSPRVL